jgi:hypothetical protein
MPSGEQMQQFCWGHIANAAEHGSRGSRFKYPQCNTQKELRIVTLRCGGSEGVVHRRDMKKRKKILKNTQKDGRQKMVENKCV